MSVPVMMNMHRLRSGLLPDYLSTRECLHFCLDSVCGVVMYVRDTTGLPLDLTVFEDLEVDFC
jgi:hypothetical protein